MFFFLSGAVGRRSKLCIWDLVENLEANLASNYATYMCNRSTVSTVTIDVQRACLTTEICLFLFRRPKDVET